MVAEFDQCRFGLSAKSGKPIQKRTKFKTNSVRVFNTFNGKFCQCTGPEPRHQRIEGSEAGEKRSKAAAIYPPKLCKALVDAVVKEWMEYTAS